MNETGRTDPDDLNQDPAELARFAEQAARWWDPDGPARTLHTINGPRLAFVEQHVRLAGARGCDVGCGGGILTESLARAGARMTGIDAAPEVIDTARMHGRMAELSIDYECAAIGDFAAHHAGRFDFVTCMELLEHVPDPGRLVADCARLVRAGGTVVFSTLNRTPAAWLGAVVGAEYLLKLLPRGTHDYRRFIRPSELARWCRGADLEPQGVRGIRYVPVLDVADLTADTSINYLLAAGRPKT